MRYRKIYDKYAPLLNGNAARDRNEFLKSGATLEQFQQKMDGFTKLRMVSGFFAVLDMHLKTVFVPGHFVDPELCSA
jgi:hypothetical protein